MTSLAFCCCIFICLVTFALGVPEAPCNDEHTDCDAGECCANVTKPLNGYAGACNKYKLVGDSCTFGHPPEGQCRCRHDLLCIGIAYGSETTTKCQPIYPG